MEHAKERFQAFLHEVGVKPSSTLLSKEKFSLIKRYLLEGTNIYENMQEKITELHAMVFTMTCTFYSSNLSLYL